MARWTAKDIPDLTGRTYVVTGANSGLGYHTTLELARHGGRVIMACRDENKGTKAAAEITATVPDADIEVRVLDLSNVDSVREFASGVNEIDVLINNAGIMFGPRRLTEAGHESQFATNHLGHFALTGLLLDRLRAGRDARVVTVSSEFHRGGRIRFDDLTGARSYSPFAFYQQSKFANVLFALELHRRLRAANVPMISAIAHPGYAATNLQTSSPTGLHNIGGRIGNVLIAQSAAAGAWNELYVATAPGVEGGQYYGPDRFRGLRGHPALAKPDRKATDPELAKRLWERSEELTGVRYAF
ncbi:MAG: SDR family NAD(P)-dependent oxidoreductase [Sciscionella sp.]|nr:SDR family NAD(P)-dependent oxidoreductase [Sciscionella sp.]